MALLPSERSRVLAVFGPTNTGKTHFAVERMLAHRSGLIGCPLRLLAREIYDRVATRKGVAAVALITGEERIQPPSARYFVATVEAMPDDLEPSFLAVDEIQLYDRVSTGEVPSSYPKGSFKSYLKGVVPRETPRVTTTAGANS